jgi:AcrR family transcriptional regulator
LSEEAPTRPRQRADARRNHERIVEAAVEVFREQGIDAPVAEIARRAGVGSGTLFRNFPTKADLIDAIVTLHVERWLELVTVALEADDATQAFDQLFTAALRFNFEDRGMLEAATASIEDASGAAECRARADGLVDQLLVRARASGALRDSITADDIRALTAGGAESVRIAVAESGERPEPVQARIAEILLKGLRP